MSERKVAPKKKEQSKRDRVKEVVRNNWKPVTVGVVLTITTYVVVKRVINPMYIPGVGTAVRAKSVNNLYIIIAQKPRSLSYVIRCDQTKAIFKSQNTAANVMNLSREQISKHLNGGLSNVSGYTFTRVGIGA